MVSPTVPGTRASLQHSQTHALFLLSVSLCLSISASVLLCFYLCLCLSCVCVCVSDYKEGICYC